MHSRLFTVRCTGEVEIRRLRMQITQSLDSENAQHNLKIAQILRLRGTNTCTAREDLIVCGDVR